MPIEAYTEAIEDARVAAERDLGLVLRWIYDIPGESGRARGRRDARPTRSTTAPRAWSAFGLGGPEVGVPRPQFQPHFDAARAAGLHSVPHAGETTGPETVWDALRLLGAERIGHGTSSAQDPALLAHLAEAGIPLEVCPSSNVATRAVASLDEHPLRAFVDAGVTVTINSDDPPMFGTDAQPGVRDRRRPARSRRGRRRRPGPGRGARELRPGGRAGPHPGRDRRLCRGAPRRVVSDTPYAGEFAR